MNKHTLIIVVVLMLLIKKYFSIFFVILYPIDSLAARDEPWPLFHIFDQHWHHLHVYSTSAGQKGLSSDTQIRVIGAMEPEICAKMLRD